MWILTALPSLLKNAFGLASKGLDYYIAKANGNVAKAVALMEADKARLLAQRDVTIAAMNSRVYWTGWALFVFPLGGYFAKILLWDKVLGLGRTDPLDGFILEWGGLIVLSLFGMQVASSVIGKIFK